jgi:A/G-specific adenine glycosylase
MKQKQFLKILEDFYREHKRDLPWRKAEPDGIFDPYKILVSEIMLQQTQVSRVMSKYEQFIKTFPEVRILATSKLHEVLSIWVGLGYNRRAKFLRSSAQIICEKFAEIVPSNINELTSLPGVGTNTAGAILVYAFNQPVFFIETNIRTVMLHHFFEGKQDVSDTEILVTLQKVVPWSKVVNDTWTPREFYWAMMDYGSLLKATIGNVSQQSKSYKKQSAFQGSKRQIRGNIIHSLSRGPMLSIDLEKLINDIRFNEVIEDLKKEQLVERVDNMLMLYNSK